MFKEVQKNLFIIEHPLVKHKLSKLRLKTTNKKVFKELVEELAIIETYEATRDIPIYSQKIDTPIAESEAHFVDEKKITIVPILRAGLGMVEGVWKMLPNAKVEHIGIYRNEKTLEPVQYYMKISPNVSGRRFLVIDPMVATGGSIVKVLDILYSMGAKNIKVIAIIVAPEGINAIHSKFPEVPVFAAALDERLNDKGYIVPGLGDAGDRIFGTLDEE